MFLQPIPKQPKKLNINATLHESIVSSRGDQAAASVVTACRTVQQLRSMAHEPPKTVMTRDALLRYHRALVYSINDCHLLGNTTTFSSTPLSFWNLNVMWTSGLDLEAFCEVPDLRLDVVSVLFNIALNEAALGISAYHLRDSSETALRTCVKHFQMAAGYFDAACNIPTPGGVRAVTADIWPDTLAAFRTLMLANAQQAFLRMCQDNQTKPTLLARFAAGTRELYAVAAAEFRNVDTTAHEGPPLAQLFGNSAAALSAYFDVLTYSLAARGATDGGHIANGIVRLRSAIESHAKAVAALSKVDENSMLPSVRQIHEELSRELKSMRKDLERRLEDAEEENRKFYLETIPESLPKIVPHRSAKVIDINNILSAAPLDDKLTTFSDLPAPPDDDDGSGTISGVAKRYADAADGLVADCCAAVNASATNARAAVDGIDAVVGRVRDAVASRDKELHAHAGLGNAGYLTEEETRAVDAITTVRKEGGVKHLRELQTQVLGQANQARDKINEIERMLQNEEEQDTKLRNFAPGQRPNSMQMTAQYRSRIGRLRSDLEQAANADKFVGADIKENEHGITTVLSVDVDGAVQTRLSIAQQSSAAKNDSTAVNIAEMKLKDIAQEVELLMKKKDECIKTLQSVRMKDNAMSVTARMSDNEEMNAEMEQFERQFSITYGESRAQLNNIREQLDSAIRTAQQEISALRTLAENASRDVAKVDEGMRGMLVVFKHEAVAIKFAELLEHLQQGLAFYIKESELIEGLRSDISGFVFARAEEYKQIMHAHQQNLNNPNVKNPNSRPYYPSSGSSHPGAAPDHAPGGYPPYSGTPGGSGGWGR